MINLFERLNKRNVTLYNSFKYSNLKVPTIVIEETGFLPDDVITPYAFFSENVNKSTKPLYFNQLKIPRLWSIEGNNESGLVKDKNKIKAKIFYQKNFKNRIIERVEWLNGGGYTQYIDYYNKYGIKYAQLILDSDSQKRIMKFYYNEHGKKFMTENYITNDVFLTWRNREFHFSSTINFMNFFIDVSGLKNESFLFNSLLKSSAIVNNIKTKGENILFWDEDINDNIVSHMHQALRNPYRSLKIIIPNSEKYEILINKINHEYKDNVLMGGYVYKFTKENNYSNQVLNLTNSDQLINIEEIIQKNKNLDFHIAAVTTMSNKLLNLSHYPNVYLYPNVTKQKCIELYRSCDIYLDINRGNEILDSVRAAYDYNLLILSYDEIKHNIAVTASENILPTDESSVLSEILYKVNRDKQQLNKRLELQHKKAGSISKENFRSIFKTK